MTPAEIKLAFKQGVKSLNSSMNQLLTTQTMTFKVIKSTKNSPKAQVKTSIHNLARQQVHVIPQF